MHPAQYYLIQQQNLLYRQGVAFAHQQAVLRRRRHEAFLLLLGSGHATSVREAVAEAQREGE